MANFRIWAPWRLAYVKDASKDIEEECIFCAKPAAEDDEANLWISTNRGVASFDPRSRTIKSYSTADGLPGLDFTGFPGESGVSGGTRPGRPDSVSSRV